MTGEHSHLPPSLTGVDLRDLPRSWRYSVRERDERGALADLTSLADEPVVVLLGSPGMGKTTELWQWHLDCSGSQWVDLGLLASPADLGPACQSAHTVFIDGCEEYTDRAGPLFAAFKRLRTSGTRLRLSSRTAWWFQHDYLHGQIGDHYAVELQPLDDAAANQLLKASARGEPRVEILSSDDHSITRNPRMLVALQRVAEETGSVFTHRNEIYEALAAAAVKEHNAALAQSRPADATAIFHLAAWLAAALVLTDRTVVTTDAIPGVDSRLSTGALHELAGPSLASAVNLDAVLQASLMTPVVGGYRFVDRSLLEYLAARALTAGVVDRGAEPDLWATLLTIEIVGETFIPPRLRGLAAWLAELNESAFDVVFEADPSVLIENDLSSHHDAGSRRLFYKVLDDDRLLRSAAYSSGVLVAAYRAASGSHALRDRLQSWQTLDVRRRAWEFIRGAEIREFDAELLATITNPEEDELLRYWASAALTEGLDVATLTSLTLALVDGHLADDDDHRVLGNVLQALWPASISTVQMLGCLVPPTATGILEYEVFLAYHLGKGLRADDLAVVLDWLALVVPSRDWDQLNLRHLGASVLELLATQLDELADGPDRSELLAALARLLAVSFDMFDRRIDFVDRLRTHLTQNDLRVITAGVVAANSSDGSAEWLVGTLAQDLGDDQRSNFVRWLFEEARDRDEPIECWIRAFARLLDPWRDRALVEEMLELDEARRRRFARLIDPVEIASIPEFVRRRRRSETHGVPSEPTEVPLGEQVLELASRADGWLELVHRQLVRHHAMRPTLEPEVLLSLSPEHLEQLRLVASAYVVGYEEPAASGQTPNTVDLRELAFANAANLLCDLDVPPAATALARTQRTLLRCAPFLRSESYDKLLVQAHDADADGFVRVALDQVESNSFAGWASDLSWLTRFPYGVPTLLTDAVVSGLVSLTGDDDKRVAVLRNLVVGSPGVAAGKSAEILESFATGAEYGNIVVVLLADGLKFAELELATKDDGLAAQVVTAIAQAVHFRDHRVANLLSEFSSAELSECYEVATRVVPRCTIPRSGYGGDRSYDVDGLRAACLRALASRGKSGVEHLRRIAAHEPLAEVLGPETLRVLVDDWWEPLSVAELARLMSDTDVRIVRTADELLRELCRALASYQSSLHGVGGGADLLWNGDRPRKETELSIDLMRYLRVYFRRSNVILNREVELRPASADDAIRGERSDVLIEATDPDRATISLVVEIKGSWHAEKYSGYRTQLVERYLRHPDVGAGLHLVYWFDRESWAIEDGRRKRSPASPSRVAKELEVKRPRSTKAVAHFVVDASR